MNPGTEVLASGLRMLTIVADGLMHILDQEGIQIDSFDLHGGDSDEPFSVDPRQIIDICKRLADVGVISVDAAREQ